MIIEKKEIASKLKVMKSVVPKSSYLIDSGVLVEGKTVNAHNGDMSITASLSTGTDTPFILPPKAIELIENLPNDKIEITPGENRITIAVGKIVNKFQSSSPDGHLKWSDKITGEAVETAAGLEGKELHEALNSILYAAAPANDGRSILTGICMECDEGEMNLVACDGYRLSWRKIKHDSPIKMTVPREAIQKLLHMDLSGTVEIIYGESIATFKLPEYTLQTRLLAGEYINYKKLFPKYNNSIIVNRNALAASVSRAMICAESDSPNIDLDIEESTLSVKTKSSIGEYAEELATDSSISSPIRIRFNARFLVDCLKSYACDNLELSFGSPVQPMIVDDGQLKSMVLPLRLQEGTSKDG